MRTNNASVIISISSRVLVCAVIWLAASCKTPGDVDQRPPPASQPACGDIRQVLKEWEVFPAKASFKERCTKTQERRFAECKKKPEGEAERCMAEVEQTMALCSNVAQQVKEEEAFIECTPVTACATTECTAEQPCTLANGEICRTGTKCNNVGAICSPGRVFDCVCTQNFHHTTGQCSCVCEW